jgi:hypothetical protein
VLSAVLGAAGSMLFVRTNRRFGQSAVPAESRNTRMPVQRSFVRGGLRGVGSREGSGDGLDSTGSGNGGYFEQARM